MGVALDKVAVPPLMDKEKSLASNAPVVFAVLNTVSLNVTAILALLVASVTPVIFGYS